MTIPSPVARTMNIHAGDTVVVDLNEETMMVRKKGRLIQGNGDA
jgi:AbrB family looped-hinge helix DNA binding protein